MKRVKSGFLDKNKTPIKEGDIVRFYFDVDKGYSLTKKRGYTELIDVCWLDKESGSFYLMCEFGGSLVWRHNDYCEVIGNVYDNRNLLKDFSDENLIDLFPKLKINHDRQN